MRTVQLTLDEELIEQVDALAKRLGTTRSALTRDALAAYEGLDERSRRAASRAGTTPDPGLGAQAPRGVSPKARCEGRVRRLARAAALG